MPNGAHGDQRRERVYGPIHDELTGILATLDANATTSQLHDTVRENQEGAYSGHDSS